MLVMQRPVNFNGKMVETIGEVLEIAGDYYLVRFWRNGTEYRGFWKHDPPRTILIDMGD